MSRSLAVLWLAAATFPTVGCMSVVNHSPLWCPDETKQERVYGGVLLNVEAARAALGPVFRGEGGRPREVLNALWVGGVLVAIDLPLCAVVDTLLLHRTHAARREHRAVVPAAAPQETAAGPPHPKNAFADLVDNKFNAWSISRIVVPLERDGSEVAPMPRRIGP